MDQNSTNRGPVKGQSPVPRPPRAVAPDPDLYRRRAALLSVYYHAHERGGGGRFLLPERLRPHPPEDVLPAIAPAHQMLALAKLVAAGGLEERHGLNTVTAELFKQIAEGPSPPEGLSPDQTRKNIRTQVSAVIAAERARDTVGLLLDSRGYSVAANNVLLETRYPMPRSNSPPQAPACQKTTTDTDVDFDVNTLVTTVTVSIDVNRPFSELAAVMNPLSWAKLGPDYFVHSYKAKVAAGEVEYGDDGDPKPADSPANPWDGWNGLLFEQFQWNWNEASMCQFRNLLNIQYVVDPNQQSLDLQYSLCQSLDSTVGFDVQAGGIDVDSGCATATPSPGKPGWWTITAKKHLRFTDRTPDDVGLEVPVDLGMALNYLAPATLGMFLDMSVYMAVCATVPP